VVGATGSEVVLAAGSSVWTSSSGGGLDVSLAVLVAAGGVPVPSQPMPTAATATQAAAAPTTSHRRDGRAGRIASTV
jgi:hypothetical protein